uniref:Smoothelin like 1 n=1 Tax=Saimiri boliviensis boliviensis TaxID=39432 RepID=A0A2K6T013_SAIBB
MEQKEEKPSEDGTIISPGADNPEMSGGGDLAEETKGTAGKVIHEGPPTEAGKQEKAPAEDGKSAELQGEANGLDEVKVESRREAGGKEDAEAELKKEDGEKEQATTTSQEMTGRKEETKSEPKEAEEKEESTLASSEKQKAEEKEVRPESKEKADANDRDKPEPKAIVGEEEAKTASQEERVVEDEAKAGPKEPSGKEEAKHDAKEEADEPGSPSEEQEQDVETGPEEGAGVTPSSPEEWPESPTGVGHALSTDGLGPDSIASGETSPSASESSPSDAPQSPPESPPSGEKKAPERRVSAPARPRGLRAQNRKAIVDKFGGAASGPTALFRNTKAAGAAIGGVKNMLLEWCRAMTRKYEHVDIQNFSSSWSSGMAFCALIHKFFPDAFDYAELDPTKRRHNFTLAFSTAEKLADCAQLLDVDDMVRLAVPDSKCVYTYIQELYRSLVQKGLVKTKKK